MTEWTRRTVPAMWGGWQRNFDYVDFDLTAGMKPVTITLERAVTVTGRVVDPDGKPVAGATVDPALSGTGNSLSGDTRFSAEDRRRRRVQAGPARQRPPRVQPRRARRRVPPVADLGQRRAPADPLRAGRGAARRRDTAHTARERAADEWPTRMAYPSAKREVRACATDRLGNRYYDPTVTTTDDGSYELKFMRPGEHFIQVAPFWLDPRQAPEGTSRVITLAHGETKDGVNFQLPDSLEKN